MRRCAISLHAYPDTKVLSYREKARGEEEEKEGGEANKSEDDKP